MEVHLPMEVLIKDGAQRFTELDFYHGSKALEGASEIISITSNVILNSEVVTKVPSIEGINTIFRDNYEGSFGQRFLLKIVGDEQAERFRALGEKTFFDIMKFYLSRPLLQQYNFSTKRAERIVNELNESYIPLMKRLHLPFLKLHKPIEEQHYSIQLKSKRTPLVDFNNISLQNLQIERPDAERVIIQASVTRFNRLRGTGRLILGEDTDSISFEPSFLWRDFPGNQKKKLSRNLDRNTDADDFTVLSLEVTAVRNYFGEIRKFLLHRVVMDN